MNTPKISLLIVLSITLLFSVSSCKKQNRVVKDIQGIWNIDSFGGTNAIQDITVEGTWEFVKEKKINEKNKNLSLTLKRNVSFTTSALINIPDDVATSTYAIRYDKKADEYPALLIAEYGIFYVTEQTESKLVLKDYDNPESLIITFKK